MTNLEETLAQLVQAIGEMSASGQTRGLAALVRRKEVICAALAAPEHAWQAPVSTDDKREWEDREPALIAALARSCA